ncbi:GGDEF domain-containing protein [Catenovulum sediminis]|uniref:diguanylate cyclase n=1 Tax=Catenovulum sediminis TaxID=1740262 RepID=A0ABV1RE30_9ALTE|nr:GGDEF domain-containing protein [Catenovulum sediminis]
MDILQAYLSSESGKANPLTSQFFNGLQRSGHANFNALAERLHASLDLNRILQTFTDEAAKYIQISGLRFQAEATTVETERFVEGIYEHITELRFNNTTLGYLTYSTYREFEPQDIRMLHNMQSKLVMPIYNGIQFYILQQQAVKDHLTQLGNRAGFDEQFELAIERCIREDQGMTLLVLDLDDFKRANDSFGHEIGDQVLQKFAQILRQSIRKTDLAFRFGGDEFAIILNTADEPVAKRVASRIQTLVAQNPLMQQTSVSCSIGCASWQNETQKQLFRRADHALYDAKTAGKNQLKCA